MINNVHLKMRIAMKYISYFRYIVYIFEQKKTICFGFRRLKHVITPREPHLLL